MIIRNLIIFFLVTSSLNLHSQTHKYSDDQNIKFAEYLINKEYYSDVVYLLEDLNFSASFRDDKNYYLGWSLYNMKKLVNSANYLSKVSEYSSHYQKSNFFASYNLLYEKKIKKSLDILDNFKIDTMYNELRYFQKAGISLLTNNLKEYKVLSNKFTYSKFYMYKEQKKFNEFYEEINNFNEKSPVLAGLLSAVIPGAGKVYIKKYGGALSSLLTCGILGLLTYENYNKAGPTSFKTVFFGSLFSVFYIGNIYGSVYAVKDYRNDFKEKIEYRILFNIHIPLRNAFK